MSKKNNKIKAVVTDTSSIEKKYEMMLVISPAITEKKRQEAYQAVCDIITEHGGSIDSEHDLGKRELAYTIAKQDEGFYILTYFKNSNAKALEALDRHFRFSQEIIRSMIVKRDDAYNHIDVSTDYDQDKETSRREKVLKSPIDYKNVSLLRNYVSRYARIVPRYYTKVTLKQQKSLSQAIKRARQVALMPFVS